MIEPFVAFALLASVSIINNAIRTVITTKLQKPTTEVVVKHIASPEAQCKWFSGVWTRMNAGKLDVTDDVIQEIFTARGKGKAAQRAFYEKYYEGGVVDE